MLRNPGLLEMLCTSSWVDNTLPPNFTTAPATRCNNAAPATVTVAGATLLQRVASAVVKFGGNVLSTQLDVQSTSSKPGFLSMIASCEIEQPQLQQLLYDLEAGMPFLFIDQLVVQTPTTGSGAQGGKLRVLLGVSGQWRGAK